MYHRDPKEMFYLCYVESLAQYLFIGRDFLCIFLNFCTLSSRIRRLFPIHLGKPIKPSASARTRPTRNLLLGRRRFLPRLVLSPPYKPRKPNTQSAFPAKVA